MSASPQPVFEQRDASHGMAVRDMFNRIAPTYDLLNRLLSAGVDRRWRRAALRRLPEKGPFLDNCAGTLDFSAMLSQARPGERVVAADFSPEMLERGAAKAPGVERVVADAMKLPFEDASFTGVVCGFGMRNLSDLSAGVAEAARVLRPGGVFVTLEFFHPVRPVTRLFHAVYNRVVLPTVGGLVSGDRRAYRYLAESMEGFCSRAGYQQLLEKSGFEAVSGQDLFLGVASLVTGTRVKGTRKAP